MADIARGYRLEFASTLATAVAVTGVTKAATAVVSANAHGLQNGEFALFSDVQGMVELRYFFGRVAAITANTFELVGVNSTNFGNFVSGTVQRVTGWTTIATATGVDFGSGEAEQIDTTPLLAVTRITERGLISLPAISVNLFSEYSAAEFVLSGIAINSVLPTAFRATRQNGKTKSWSGYPSTIGESVQVNAAITGSFTITPSMARYGEYAV